MQRNTIHPGFLLAGLLAALAAGACHAEGKGLVVTALTASRPTVVGRYAAVQCTVRDSGPAAFRLKALAINIRQGDGSATPFGVWPFINPKLPAPLRPGERYAFREFQRITSPGDYSCTVTAQGGDGKWTPLTFADGSPATVVLHAVPAAAVPQVQCQVNDPRDRHVYHAGDTIRVAVLPILSGGPEITSRVADVTVATPAKPFSSTDPALAKSLLLGPAPPDSQGFSTDFFGVPAAQKYLDLTVRFQHPVELGSFTLTGENLNGEYSLANCQAQAVLTDGALAEVPSRVMTTGGRWSALSTLPHSLPATGLRLRLFTPYKINIRSLNLTGNPAAGRAVTNDARVTARWQDVDGKALSPATRLTLFQENTVASPPRLAAGYYALVVTTRIAGLDDSRHEYGFAVLSARSAVAGTAPKDPRFDFVHADMNDPNIGMSWNKTMATGGDNVDTKGWRQAIAARSALGVHELPLVADKNWGSDNARPVPQDQFDRLRAEMTQYFRAVPEVGYWELGIEENLGYRGDRAKHPDFWTNLDAKARAVRQAAADAHADEKFVYQIAENDPQTAEEFLKSDAAKRFDVLALHPYWWPDFPTPETWMPDYLQKVRGDMARYHAQKPIWLTEIGAPVDANPGGFLGYPGNPGVFDKALSRTDHAAFTVKCYLVAWRHGIDKVFWYNYRDGGSDPEYAEDNFGMIDFWGFPKPTYVAYAVMAALLQGKPLQSTSVVGGGVQVCRFRGSRQDVLAVWAFPAAKKSVSWTALHVPPARVAGVKDLYGRALTHPGGSLQITAAPVYVLVDH